PALIWRLLISVCLTLASANAAHAQVDPPFAPPPQPSVVASPAAATTPQVDYSVTPTPVATEAKPLEGGEILAKIDGEIVLASDVLWQVNMILDANRDRIPPDQVEDARRALLRQQIMGLIDTKVLYAEFKRKVPHENIPKIEENLAQPFEDSEVPRLCEA